MWNSKEITQRGTFLWKNLIENCLEIDCDIDAASLESDQLSGSVNKNVSIQAVNPFLLAIRD